MYPAYLRSIALIQRGALFSREHWCIRLGSASSRESIDIATRECGLDEAEVIGLMAGRLQCRLEGYDLDQYLPMMCIHDRHARPDVRDPRPDQWRMACLREGDQQTVDAALQHIYRHRTVICGLFSGARRRKRRDTSVTAARVANRLAPDTAAALHALLVRFALVPPRPLEALNRIQSGPVWRVLTWAELAVGEGRSPSSPDVDDLLTLMTSEEG